MVTSMANMGRQVGEDLIVICHVLIIQMRFVAEEMPIQFLEQIAIVAIFYIPGETIILKRIK